jgi:hypothetical protein
VFSVFCWIVWPVEDFYFLNAGFQNTRSQGVGPSVKIVRTGEYLWI